MSCAHEIHFKVNNRLCHLLKFCSLSTCSLEIPELLLHIEESTHFDIGACQPDLSEVDTNINSCSCQCSPH